MCACAARRKYQLLFDRQKRAKERNPAMARKEFDRYTSVTASVVKTVVLLQSVAVFVFGVKEGLLNDTPLKPSDEM